MRPLEGGGLRHRAEALLGAEVRDLTPVVRGGNNRLYRLRAGNGRDFAFKTYARDPADPRDRLGTEFDGLGFLWRRGVRQVPRPIARGGDAALYGWIEGEEVATPGLDDIADVVAFIGALREAGRTAEAWRLPLASEARLSAAEIVRQIAMRRDALARVRDRELQGFLVERIAPAGERLAARAAHAGISLDAEVAPGARVLSPSDFGFHNALRRADSKLIFLDFEYFGWDDPAKLIADFELHPAMNLTPALKAEFRRAVLALFPDQPDLAARVAALAPLFALRWCLIMLNPFLPQGSRRHAYLGGDESLESFRRRRLGAAERMFDDIPPLLGDGTHDC